MSAVFTATCEGVNNAGVVAGDSGAPFTAVAIATTTPVTTITYDISQKFAAGLTSVKFLCPTGATAVLQEGAVTGAQSLAITSLRYYRGYVYFSANPSASVALLRGRDAFSTNLVQLMIRSTGAFELRNGVTTVYTGNSAVPLTAQWVRYLLKLDPAGTSMTLSLWYGTNINGGTPDVGPNTYSYTPVATAQAANASSSGSLNRMDYGPSTAQSNALTVWMDGIVEDNAADPGPATNVVHTLSPASGITPTTVTATATGYGLPAGSRSWAFNWGDGTAVTTLTTATGVDTKSATHTYAAVTDGVPHTDPTQVTLTVT